jgi:hypothetical protein
MRIAIWWSLFMAVTGGAFNFVSLYLSQFLFGAGEAGCYPNIGRMFSIRLPPLGTNSRPRAHLPHKPPGLFHEGRHRNQADQFLDKQAARLGGWRRPGAENSVHQFGHCYRGKGKVERAISAENAFDEVSDRLLRSAAMAVLESSTNPRRAAAMAAGGWR